MLKKLISEKFHWQNLNDLPNGKVGQPIYGRCWYRIIDEITLRFEWNLKAHFCHIYINFNKGDDAISTSFALPPVAFWFSVENTYLNKMFSKLFKDCYYGREFGIRIIEWIVFWNIFSSDWGWSSDIPKWKDGSINILDLLFGKQKYSTETISEKEIEVPMLEKNYKAKIKMFESTWKRPRWFAEKLLRAEIDMIEPIPEPGKGTCDYNCGDDATFGITVPAKTPEEAVGKLVESVLESRMKRMGSWKWNK